MITDAYGVPLVVCISPANVHDSLPAMGMVDRIPTIGGPRGRPRRRPDVLLGDRAYGTARNYCGCRERGIHPILGKPGTSHGSGLGVLRYVVERTQAWFGNCRRLKICYERTGEHFQAFHDLAAALICARKLAVMS